MEQNIRNALTIDVEDYFMVSAFEQYVEKKDWDRYENRVVPNTRKILSILGETGTKGTFFVLGWVAEKYPELAKEIHQQGHEVACHGYAHRLIYDQTKDEFRQDIRRAKKILESTCGAQVLGYRAPSFSVIEDTQWALDVLAEEGFSYDASVFPAPHSRGGLAGAKRYPYRLNGLMEFPMSTVRILGKNFAFSGGGYFRLLPYPFIRWGIQSCNREGFPSIVYLHPWEFDPEQPRMKAKAVDRFKHYLNLDKTEAKFRNMIRDFEFGTIQDSLKSLPAL